MLRKLESSKPLMFWNVPRVMITQVRALWLLPTHKTISIWLCYRLKSQEKWHPYQRIIAPLASKSIHHFQNISQQERFFGARGSGPKQSLRFSIYLFSVTFQALRKILKWILVHLAASGKCGYVIRVEMQGLHENDNHFCHSCNKAYWALDSILLQLLLGHGGKGHC